MNINYYSRGKKTSSREGTATARPHSCLLLRVPARQRAGRSLAGPRSAGACTVTSPPVLRGKNTFMTGLSSLFLLLPPRSQTLITNSLCLFHTYQAPQNQYLPDISQHKISLPLTSLACLLYPILLIFFLNTGPEPYRIFPRCHRSNANFHTLGMTSAVRIACLLPSLLLQVTVTSQTLGQKAGALPAPPRLGFAALPRINLFYPPPL